MAHHCTAQKGCARTVQFEVSTRMGSGFALGCARFTNAGVSYMTRTTTQVVKYWRNDTPDDVLVASVTVTTVESREGTPIVSGPDAECGEETYDVTNSSTPPLPSEYDYTEVLPADVSYEDEVDPVAVCGAATSAMDWGDWSEWETLLSGVEPVEVDVDSGSIAGMVGLLVASAGFGAGLETRLRIKGAWPVALAWVAVAGTAGAVTVTREVLEPGTERVFAAPLSTNCELEDGLSQIEHTLACICPVHRMEGLA